MRLIRISEFKSFAELGEFRDLTPEELKQVYALVREQFTAADLQQFTEEEEGVPMEDLLEALRDKQRRTAEEKG